jgi:hypothetical protein
MMSDARLPKRYLGDGVYAEVSRCGVLLTVQDGTNATNIIYLEPDVMRALEQYLKEARLSHASHN